MGHGKSGRCMLLKARLRCVSVRWGRLRQQRKGGAAYGAVRQGLLRNGSNGQLYYGVVLRDKAGHVKAASV